MSPVWARSFEMSIPSSFSEPRTTGNSISRPSYWSTAGDSLTTGSWEVASPSPAAYRPALIGPIRVTARAERAQRVEQPSERPRSRDSGAQRLTERASEAVAVDFDLNEDQFALREGARELLDGVSPPEAVRQVVEAGGGRNDAIWSAMVEQGWL